MTGQRTITVFGSATTRPGDFDYEEAQSLGGSLASMGWAVATGGYAGTMEAVSRGAKQAGGHTLGVTCDQIEAWRGAIRNAWVDEEIRHKTLRGRLYELIQRGQILVAMPGGIGTLSEVALSWSLIQTGEIDPRPLILVGQMWRATFDTFLTTAGSYVPTAHGSLLTFAGNAKEASDWIANYAPTDRSMSSQPLT
jgi:uncharacterized protein (TIGR00730 family)